jgi:hypothetical protein
MKAPSVYLRRASGLLALAGLLLVGAVGAASASAAQPEFAATGGFPLPFTLHNTTSRVLIDTGSEGQHLCTSLTGEGTITGARSGTATLRLSKCAGLPRNCYNGGSTEMTTLPLSVVPVYAAGKAVALEFAPEIGTRVAKLICAGGGNGAEIKGSILATVGKPRVRTLEQPLAFTEAAGKQNPGQYEGESGLTGSWLEFGYIAPPEATVREGWEASTVLSTARTLEIRG